MGKQLAPFERELYQRVDEVLHYMWDPIGVSESPEARDEYYSYLPVVFGMLVNGSSGEAISEYLNRVVTENIGLSAQTERSERAATVLLRWKQTLREQYGA